MHPEIQELHSKLKEILYDCAVEIRATKAALYLYDSESRFELVTEYGFRGGVREMADRNDPIVDRCGRGRTPFFVNGLSVEPRFSELLYEAGTDRLLAAPIYLRGQLVGVIDMRDKAAKHPFDANDLPIAQRIAERIAELFASKNVFGQRFITLSEAPNGAVVVGANAPIAQTVHGVNVATAVPMSPHARPDVPPRPAPPPAAPAAAPPPKLASSPAAVPKESQGAHSHVPRLATLILESRTAAERIVVPQAPETITDAEVSAIRDVLRAMLLVPGVTVASFCAFGHLGGVQEIAARSTLNDEGMKFLQSKLNIWLTKRGESGGFVRTNVQLPFGTQPAPIMPEQMQKVFTAPVAAGMMRGLYLTVAFAAKPDRAAHELLGAFHSQLQLTIEHSMSRGVIQSSRAQVADVLLEPDFTHYPELRRHSDAVASRSESLAMFVAMSQSEVETTRIVAIVHDVGMRLLDYDRLYRKRDLSPDEMGILREHVSVGAAIVEPLLGNEIARSVLCHHERYDGRGYPNELRGEEISIYARVIQICDAYEAMVSTDNYQPPESHEKAMAIITRGAGSQFDPELTHRFVEMMRGVR